MPEEVTDELIYALERILLDGGGLKMIVSTIIAIVFIVNVLKILARAGQKNKKVISVPKNMSDPVQQYGHQNVKDDWQQESLYINSMEDRRSDWLAMQIKEEQRDLTRISDMLDLKMSHEVNCEARDLIASSRD